MLRKIEEFVEVNQYWKKNSKTKKTKKQKTNKQTKKQWTSEPEASVCMVIANENYLKTLSSLAEGYKSFIIDYYRFKMSFFLKSSTGKIVKLTNLKFLLELKQLSLS